MITQVIRRFFTDTPGNIPGKNNVIADLLSWSAHIPGKDNCLADSSSHPLPIIKKVSKFRLYFCV